MNKNATVLSYRESLLRESDIDLLTGPYWLNDTIISFYFEYLENEVFQENKSLLFISPEVTQCIKISSQNEVGIFLDPLVQPSRKDFIFFALNDNEMTEYSGGSHWSLLVFSHPERMIFHFDSSNGSNENQAIEFSEKVLRYFSLPIQGKFESVPCLQQNNSYDCGVHVLCNAEQAAAYASYHRRIRGCPKLHQEKVGSKRWEVMKIIDKLRLQVHR